MKLPLEFKTYFWDVDFEELEFEKYKTFIAERILVYGNMEAVKWLNSHSEKTFLQNLINTSKRLDKKTISFWKLYFEGIEYKYSAADAKRAFF